MHEADSLSQTTIEEGEARMFSIGGRELTMLFDDRVSPSCSGSDFHGAGGIEDPSRRDIAYGFSSRVIGSGSQRTSHVDEAPTPRLCFSTGTQHQPGSYPVISPGNHNRFPIQFHQRIANGADFCMTAGGDPSNITKPAQTRTHSG